MALDKTISGLIESQLPDFINAKYEANAPSFRRFIELYYEWLEVNSTTGVSNTAGNTVYHIMNSEKYRDIDTTEDGFLTYFKSELLPFFPERTELELTKILKGAKEFYLKKGTEDSIKWLFRVLFNKEANIFYPKDNILKASDGKWQLPKSIKVSDSPFFVQTAGSTRNFHSVNVAPTSYHSSNTFINNVEFDNNLRRNSTLLGFASYKIWVNTGTSGTTIYNSLIAYLASSQIVGTMTDSAGTVFTNLLSTPSVSTNRSGYSSQVMLEVMEAFYLQDITSDAKRISYDANLTKATLEAVFGTGANTVTLQFDGIQVFEIGNLEPVDVIASNSIFRYATTSANVIVSVDAANTPAYVFTFGKEERGTVLNVDTANNATLANSKFGDDRFVLEYDKVYRTANNLGIVKSASAANVGLISFAFREKQKTSTTSLERRVVTGLTSKATATVEKAFTRIDEYTKSQYTEMFLSNIRGEFINNELIEIDYVDSDDNSRVFSERIFGFVGSVVIDPNKRGLTYKVNDPVVIFGGSTGSDATSAAGFSQATAYVSNVTSGRVVSLDVVSGGFGYRADPNTTVTVVNDPSNPEGVEGNITIGSVLTSSPIALSLANDTIQPYSTKVLNLAGGWGLPACTTANITGSQTLSSLFRFETINFYPIESLVINNGGHDYSAPPTLLFNTVFQVDGTTNIPISSLGMIANVTVVNGGAGYSSGDTVNFTGSGIGAVGTLTVTGGKVTSVTFANQGARGFGYTTMPAVTITSSGGSGAILKAYGFNDGAEVALSVDDVGKINEITMENLGFGYSSTPLASLKIIDVYVSNLGTSIQDDQELTVYQGASLSTADFTGNVDAYYTSLDTATLSSNNTIRVYDYNGAINVANSLVITQTSTNLSVIGYKIYGNGQARANVNFVDGTVSYPGYFLNTDGFVSADKKLQNNDKYHNFSYVLESEKQLNDYNQTLFNIVHPAGMQLIAHTKVSDAISVTVDPAIGQYIKVYQNTGNINAGAMLFSGYYAGSNANANLNTANTCNITSNSVSTTNFNTMGPSGGALAAGDTIILNYTDAYRQVTLTIQDVASSTRLNTTQPVIISGFGLLTLNSSSVYATCSENVAGKILVNDYLRIFDKFDYDVTGNDNHVVVRRVAASPTNNIIQLASAPPISNSNLGYWIDPDFRNVPIKIERNI
jgi:hypothetical protein